MNTQQFLKGSHLEFSDTHYTVCAAHCWEIKFDIRNSWVRVVAQ